MKRFSLSLFVLLVLIEGFLRISDPFGFIYGLETGKYLAAMQTDKRFAYIHASNYQSNFQGVNVSINSRGLRGPEFPLNKPTDTHRILVLGDSLVFGWGVEENNRFTSLLQQMLFAGKHDSEVIAAGVGSWNTRTEFEYFRSIGIHYKPDTVIWVFAPGDAQPKRIGQTKISKDMLFPASAHPKDSTWFFSATHWLWNQLCNHSSLINHAQYMVRKAVSHPSSRLEKTSPQWRDVENAIDGMIDLCREKHINLIPVLYASEKSVDYVANMKLYDLYFRQHQIQTHLLPDKLFTNSIYRNSLRDRHPNALGHEVIARTILKHL